MPVDPKRVRDIFLAAAELSAADRPDHLDRVCGTDADLRAAVERLLAAHAAPASLLESPAANSLSLTGPHTPQAETGTILAGRYKLLEPIGEGGMGSVWTARQTEPVKRMVAVKLIKPGMDSKTVLARFEAERQALALMDHPNIARVFDASATAEGLPFFVMELVKGVPITKFCDDRRLTLRERLELFVPVCQAIQHAHQKGVIHRDIKPSNVLVALYDDRPVPKVIDFGVAKAIGQPLTEHTLNTGFGTVVGTPQYMSPEQATFNNLDVDTRSDLYSLGVLLYELLVGSPPFTKKDLDQAGVLEMLRVVREVEPPRPSTKLSTADALPSLAANRSTEPKKLTGMLRNELDWVVMKALEKDRTRRYETANGFAADILRYISGEPVLAVPPSAGYRMRKFVRKHKGRVLAVSVVVLALVVGSGLALGFGLEANKQADEAKRKQKDADDAAEREKVAATRATGEAQRADTERNDAIIARNDAKRETEKATKAANALADQVKEMKRWLDLNRLRESQAFFNEGQYSNSRDTLDEIAPENRCMVWGLLAHPPQANLFTLYGHTSRITSVAMNAEGSRVVTGSLDKTARVWDTRIGQSLLELKGHTDFIWSVAMSADGKRIVTGSYDKTARVWDGETGQQLFKLEHPSVLWSVAMSADGTRIATLSADQTARVWDGRTGERRLEIKLPNPAGSVAMSADGLRIVALVSEQFFGRAGPDSSVRVWDARTGQQLLEIKLPAPAGSVAMSADGSRIVTGSHDKTARVWDGRTGQPLLALKHLTELSNAVVTVAVSADGSRIVTGTSGVASVWDARTGLLLHEFKGHMVGSDSVTVAVSADGSSIVTGGPQDKTVRVWDGRSGQSVLALKGHKDRVWSVAASEDGSRIVSGSEDKTARVWDGRTGQLLYEIKLPTGVHGVAMSADGSRIVTGGDKVARVLNGRTGEPLLELNHPSFGARIMAFSADNSRIITVSEQTRVWDAKTGQFLFELKEQEVRVTVNSLAVSADGSIIVTGTDKTPRVWDAKTGQFRFELKGHTSTIYGLAVSADGRRIVTGSQDETARVWDAKTGQSLLELKGHKAGLASVAVSADGMRIVTGAYDGAVRVWDGRTGQSLVELKVQAGVIDSLALTAGDSRIVAGCGDHIVRVWDTRMGPLPLELKGHERGVFSAVVSADGSRIVTGALDRTARVWDAKTGQSLLELKHPTMVSTVAVSADASRIVTGAYGNTAWVWNGRTGEYLRELKLGGKDRELKVAISSDGSRIATRTPEGETVWDTATGKPLPEVPAASIAPPDSRTPDGAYLFVPLGDRVRRVSLRIDEDERLRRQWLTRPDPEWNVKRQKELAAEGNAYGAKLHQAFEQQARGTLAFEAGEFERAFWHFIAAAALMPQPPAPPEIVAPPTRIPLAK